MPITIGPSPDSRRSEGRRTILFALVIFVGRITRFVSVALGTSGLHNWLI
jgi:hypothetical protein